jgi:hypothetical protein
MVCLLPGKERSNHLEVEMIFLPIVFLLLGAIATWYVRNRPARISWIISTSTTLLVWLLGLALLAIIPDVNEVSVWRPESLFLSQSELKLDAISWPFIYASATLLLVIVLTQPARYKMKAHRQALLLIYAVSPMVSMLSGNILTFTMTWMLMDVVSIIVSIDLFDRENRITSLLPRLSISGASLILILLAAMLNVTEGGNSSLSDGFVSSGSVLLLALAAMLRLGFFQFNSGALSYPAERHGIEILQTLLPAGASLALLARIFDIGVPEDVVLWLSLAGGLTLLIGGVQWVFYRDESRVQQAFKLAISGLGIYVASSGTSDASAITAVGALMILIGGVFYSIEIFSPPHRIWPILCAIIIAGCPWTPGGVVLSNLIVPFTSLQSIFRVVVGIIGMVLLCMGTLRYYDLPSVKWLTAESSVRFMYGVGLSFPVIVLFGLGLRMYDEINLVGIAGFLIIGVLSVLFTLAIRKLPIRDVDRWGRLLAWIDIRPIVRIFAYIGRWIMGLARAASDVLEGEGAMLWIVVILLLTYLGVRGAA